MAQPPRSGAARRLARARQLDGELRDYEVPRLALAGECAGAGGAGREEKGVPAMTPRDKSLFRRGVKIPRASGSGRGIFGIVDVRWAAPKAVISVYFRDTSDVVRMRCASPAMLAATSVRRRRCAPRVPPPSRPHPRFHGAG